MFQTSGNMTEAICVCVMAFQSTRLSMGCGSKNLVNGYYRVVYFCYLGNVLTVICTGNTYYLCKYCLSFNQYLLFHSLPLFLAISLFPKISLSLPLSLSLCVFPSLSLYLSIHKPLFLSLISENLQQKKKRVKWFEGKYWHLISPIVYTCVIRLVLCNCHSKICMKSNYIEHCFKR